MTFRNILLGLLVDFIKINIFLFLYDRLMICCEQYAEWFHVKCIRITEADAAQTDENDTPKLLFCVLLFNSLHLTPDFLLPPFEFVDEEPLPKESSTWQLVTTRHETNELKRIFKANGKRMYLDKMKNHTKNINTNICNLQQNGKPQLNINCPYMTLEALSTKTTNYKFSLQTWMCWLSPRHG